MTQVVCKVDGSREAEAAARAAFAEAAARGGTITLAGVVTKMAIKDCSALLN